LDLGEEFVHKYGLQNARGRCRGVRFFAKG
jgi:hypothetical protein